MTIGDTHRNVMSFRNREAKGTGSDAPRVSLLSRIVAKLREHVRTWPKRQIEMQVEALGGEK